MSVATHSAWLQGRIGADRWAEDRQVHPGRPVLRQPFAATVDRPDQAERVQQYVGQRHRPDSGLHRIGFGGRAAGPEHALEERERRVQREVLPGALVQRGEVVADERRQPDTPISCAVASASLLTSVVKIASKPAFSASRAAAPMSAAVQPAPGMTLSPTR